MSDSPSKKQKRQLPDLDDVVRRNPDVDADELREAWNILDRLRRDGVSGPTYRIVSPYERRPRRESTG
jgi:hypothetical protein